ncbi:MAG: hypothetical protein AAB553_06960 [Patescibacteria group bacterium]
MPRGEQAPHSAENEQLAFLAENAYLDVGSLVPMGMIPSPLLQKWRTEILGGKTTPQRRFTAAWINVETGYSRFHELNRGIRPSVPRDEVMPHFQQAQSAFDVLAKDTTATKLLQLQAKLASISIPPLQAMYGIPDDDALDKARSTALQAQGTFSEAALDYVKKSKTSHDQTFLHSLTALTVLNGDPNFLVSPTSPRFWDASVDPSSRLHLSIIDLAKGYEFGVHVGSEGDMLHVDPTDLSQSGYNAAHPYGTLQAVIDYAKQARFANAIRSARTQSAFTAANSQFDRLGRNAQVRDRHLHTVTERIEASLTEQLTTDVVDTSIETTIHTPEEALGWYENLAPRFPLRSSSAKLHHAITLLDGANQRNELEPHEIASLAWMHLELGLTLAQEDGHAQPHFSKADMLFSRIAAITRVTGEKTKQYNALLAEATVPLYATVAGVGYPIEAQAPVTSANMLSLAEQLLTEKTRLGNKNPSLTKELDRIQGVALCIALLAGDQDLTHVAAPSTLRQSQEVGWGINVWLQTAEGFSSNYFSRLQVTPDHSQEPAPGEVTFDNNLLLDLLAERDAIPAKPEEIDARQERIAAAREMVKQVADRDIE